MITMFRKIICLLLVLVLVSSLFGITNVSAATDVDNDITDVSVNYADSDYATYISSYSSVEDTVTDIKTQISDILEEDKNVCFNINVGESGLYTIGMNYKSLDKSTDNICFGLMIDGHYPYGAAKEFEIPRMWCDEEGEIRTDAQGNEFAAQQIVYDDFYFNKVVDSTLSNGFEYYVYFEKGEHSIVLEHVQGKIQIDYIEFGALKKVEKYQEPKNNNLFYEGSPIIIEGESANIKSSYFLVGKNDPSTVKITPNDPTKSLINYIGGGNWKTIGDKIIWETPEVEEGYYQIGFSYRQNSVIGGKTYRMLEIDGEVPFEEAKAIGFPYNDNWMQNVFSNEKDEPYWIYLSKGKHEIALTVVAGDIAGIRSALTEAVSELGDLYVEITMITGETVDTYRDYELFEQIPDMEDRLNAIRNKLNEAAENLLIVSGQDSGSNYSIIKNMVEVINQMMNNKFEAHRYKKTYYTNYCSVSSVLQDLRNMPLDLDKIVLYSGDEDEAIKSEGFFEQLVYSVKRFLVTFVSDYSLVSTSDSENNITIWVNWGRDQAQVLSSLIDRSFTPKTGISVNLQLVNATVVQAVLSGNGPDCILQHSRSEPVNLAMRGALYDLTQFDDLDEVLTRFMDGAEVSYKYKGGLYALPDTQSFYMMFYRKDILEEFEIAVPQTWEQFDEAAKILMRNNMSVWMPNNAATNNAQINAGVGHANIFPSLLLQNDLELYSEDGKSTTLLSADVMEVFGKWTDYYTKQKFPLTLDFYNRFRIGTTPIGVSIYSFYTTLKVAAPEIDGLWGVTAIPGVLQEDGTVSQVSAGSGTACAILSDTKNATASWEFLKWWTEADTQLTFSNDVESIIGPAGRITTSNVEALRGLSWDEGTIDEIINAWEQVEEVPEYPGSYYVTRSIYQSFWNVVNDNKNTKDMLMQYGQEANDEIARKWKQYSNRGK